MQVLGKAFAPQAKLFAGCAQSLGTTGAPAPTHPTLYKPTRQPTHAPRTFQRGWCALITHRGKGTQPWLKHSGTDLQS